MNHPTIRTLAGAAAPRSLPAGRTALLVIDFQNEYFSGRMPIPDGAAALGNARKLIAHADAHGLPVFHIQHVTPPEAPVFAEHGDGVRFHDDLQPGANHRVVRKTSVSVFPTTDLERQLKDAGIGTLVISGLMTHACVAGAARDAVPLGFEVIVVSDACATRDLDSGDGRVLPHADLHRAALASIDDTFGAILSTGQVLALPLD
ncbi:cysteine hydrolase [Lysobacter sp. K5869]|uniref:cysteine hydrolase family protein n=1 Tax=Lysobacter sp. K5869 TaxID=2820808 RepID=UPI001C062E58|nr:cysteine hydrolase family protein [Lysobacter sp. K5869]QWP75989.1 cysteine hydrolase [Lysobacter sp. K5869]